jgi:hypothetical protein
LESRRTGKHSVAFFQEVIEMPIRQDLVAFRRIIGQELKLKQDQIRHLIGDAHWPTDGEYKESILRSVLRTYSGESLRIGRGFVCFPDEGDSTGQLDVLITSSSSSVLFRDSDLVFVTADSVRAVIEVKTALVRGVRFEETLTKLAGNLQRIRANSTYSRRCWGGLFVFDSGNRLTDTYVLEALQAAAGDCEDRAINCVSIGPDQFFRFWPIGHPDSGLPSKAAWHSYTLHQDSHSYFLGNLIVECSPDVSHDDERSWFTVPGGKEGHKHSYAYLDERTAHRFN